MVELVLPLVRLLEAGVVVLDVLGGAVVVFIVGGGGGGGVGFIGRRHDERSVQASFLQDWHRGDGYDAAWLQEKGKIGGKRLLWLAIELVALLRLMVISLLPPSSHNSHTI